MRKDQFDDFITNDLAWRKVEISQLFTMLQTDESRNVISKSLVLLLYAHWEGFIKKSSKCYLKYVSEKKIRINELTLNFKAIVLKKYAADCIKCESMNLSKEIAFINKEAKMDGKKFKIAVKVDDDFEEDIINTHHNLNSKVLKSITEIIGIRYNSAINSRANYIDGMLLKNRNAIGHAGRAVSVGEDEQSVLDFNSVEKLKEFVIAMLDYYALILQDYVENEYYLCANDTKREEYEAKKEQQLMRKITSL